MTVRETFRLAMIDGALLGLFMISVGVFAVLIASPQSPLGLFELPPLAKRALMGAAMGTTAFLLISSRWGGRSGAHMNPAVTVSYLRLGRIPPRTAMVYVPMQVLGGIAGVLIITLVMGRLFTDAPVMYAATNPGPLGSLVAFAAEFAIAFAMFSIVLWATNSPTLARHTPKIVGVLLFLYITLEEPLSGMSLNPARTLASAVPAGAYGSVWVYLIGPLAGMLAAAEVRMRLRGGQSVHCCKINHENHEHCPFCGCDGPIDFASHGNPTP